MNYRDYVIAAYAVFVVVLLWDFVVPRIQIRQQLRAARARAARAMPKPSTPPTLSRE